MVRMINAGTGTEMRVAENRVDEYLAAGHKLAADPIMPEPTGEDVPEEKPKKTRTRKK